MKSDCRNSSSLLDIADAGGLRISPAVRFWLQAIAFMPKALAIAAVRVPSLPRPSTPSVMPSRSGADGGSAMWRRHAAARSRSRCGGSVRASSPMAMPEVGLPNEPVPQTVTPRALAASVSIEALRMPVVMRSFRSGSASITAFGKPVRSRMATTIWKPCSAAMTLSGPPRCSLKTLSSTSPLTLDQSATLRTTFW